MGNSRLRFAFAFPALFLLCLAATALAAGGGAKTGAPHGAKPAVIAQAPKESKNLTLEIEEDLEDRFLVEQAVDAGLDTERAGRMSAILLAFRKNTRAFLYLSGQGKFTRAEFFKRAREEHADRREKLKALLGVKFYTALDRGKAIFRASQVVFNRPSMIPFVSGEQLVKDCKGRPSSFCGSYIMAVVDSRLATAPARPPGVGRFCIPRSIFMSRARPITIIRYDVLTYLEITPAARAKVGFEAVAEALAAKFPC